MATTQGRIRRRPRDLEIEDAPKSKVTPGMRELAKLAHLANLKKNEGSREENSNRKKLYQLMKDAKVTSFEMESTINKKRIKLKAEITASVQYVVDVEKLRKLVSKDVFMQCIKATQSDVVDVAGRNVSNQCVTTVQGNENVSIKVVKA